MTEKPTYEELEKKIQELEQLESNRQKSEEQLIHSHDLLDYVVSHARVAIAIHDRDLRYIYVSKQYLKEYKVKEKNVIGRHHYEIFPDLPQKWRDAHQRSLTGEVLSAEEDPYYREDGSVDWTRWECRPWYESDDSIGGIIIYTEVITERINMAESLRQSEHKLATHLQNTPIGALAWDLDFKVIEWNPAAETIFGYSKAEAMGKHPTEIILHEELKEMVDGVYRDLISGTGGTHSTNKNITKDGRLVICDWYNTILKDPNGKAIGAASLVQDITEREETLDALREQKEFNEKIIQTSSAIIVGLDKNRKIKLFNKGAEKITGFKGKEVIGKDWFKIFFKPGIYDEMDQVWENSWGIKTHSYVNPIQVKTGAERIVSWQGTGMYDSADDTKHLMLSIGEDITERVQAEVALKESEEKYRSMMESMKDASYICSPKLYVEYMNPAMIERVGSDAAGERCYKALYKRDKQCSWCVFEQIKKGENVDYELADPLSNRFYSVSNSPVFRADGEVSKLTIFHDITEIKNIEAQLRQSQKMESLGTLSGGIAHDFNNLLYMISGNTELALEDIPKWNPVHTNLEEIKTASLRAADIVRQLLDFSRRTDQKLEPIGAVTVIKDAVKFLRSTIPTTIDIRKHLPDVDITILADPIQINQVMMNLCINASQAMEETGGILEINAGNVRLTEESAERYLDLPAGDYLKITVSDTGPGIAPEIIDQLFDPYFTTKETGKGSGLGLSIVHGIVKSHDGAVSVESKLGKGTTFVLLFPVVAEKPQIETETIDEIPRGHETILFVDDEESITDMTKRMLERLGYKVQTSMNPVEALDLFLSQPGTFDLVITDMTMPQMTGVKLFEKLRDIRPDIPVIICTGHSSLVNAENAKQLGVDAYVMKPVSVSMIAKAIRKVLDKEDDE